MTRSMPDDRRAVVWSPRTSSSASSPLVMVVGRDPGGHHQERRARRPVPGRSCSPASAAQFILLAAEFVAVTQVLVYIGAIVVLFLFGIMLTRAPHRRRRRPRQRAALVIGGARRRCCSPASWATSLIDGLHATTVRLRRLDAVQTHRPGHRLDLLAPTSIPFEVVSVLLLAALIGAIVLARRD